MPTKHPQLFADLCAPFEAHQVKTLSKGGHNFSYVTARSIMNRLDSVLGPEMWSDRLTMLSESSFLCELTIILPDGTQVTKSDVGGMAGMADAGDDDKSGASDAFKRAAAKVGVGRYLYRDGTPIFAVDPESAEVPAAAPAPPRPPTNGQASPQQPRRDQPSTPPSGNAPRSGKALFAWCKEQEEKTQIGLIKYLNGWAKLQEWPPRMIDWDDSQVALGHDEAVRKIQSAEFTAGQPAAPPKPTGDPVVDILRLRQDLINAVWRVARKAKGEHADNSVYWSVMDGLNNAVGSNRGGEVLGDLDTCNDPELIRAYIEAAGEAWKFAQGGTAA